MQNILRNSQCWIGIFPEDYFLMNWQINSLCLNSIFFLEHLPNRGGIEALVEENWKLVIRIRALRMLEQRNSLLIAKCLPVYLSDFSSACQHCIQFRQLRAGDAGSEFVKKPVIAFADDFPGFLAATEHAHLASKAVQTRIIGRNHSAAPGSYQLGRKEAETACCSE